MLFGLCVVVFVVAANAQEPSKPDAPGPDPAAATGSVAGQQPGAGAQVRTGSAIGDGELTLANRLAILLSDHQFLEMEKVLKAQQDAPEGASKLTPEQAQLYKGILANRMNQPEESVRLLEPLVAKIRSADHPPEEKILRKALAEDYLRMGDWARANQAYLEYEYRVGGGLSQDEKDELELPVKLLPLARENPPMTVEPGEAFSLPYDRDPLGLTDIPVFVDARSHDWMLDPTLPFNLICRTTAKEVGLTVSEAAVTIHTLTGRPMQVHVTMIPRLTLGTVTYRNMTAFVFEDADYYFPGTGYQVRGVLGYPAVSALGSITVTAGARIEVEPGEKGERLTTGARFFLDGDQVIAALGKPDAERMFAIDAGGQQTYLTARYYAEHTAEFADRKAELQKVPGALGRAPVFVPDLVTLQVGETAISLQFPQVLTQPLGDAAFDDIYGKLGMDALDELRSYTFDYRTMRFAVRNQQYR